MPRIAATLAALLFCSIASAQTTPDPQYGDDKYRPQVGQVGKNVIWVPTPDALVTAMLRAAKVKDTDIVYDLGSGDGKIPIAAARDFKARAVGIEYNPEMAALATRNAQRAGVADKVKIIAGDIFENDFSAATVVTLYLLPDLNLKLRPQILKMKPGTRVVSHAFNMREWEPDQTIDEGDRTGYLWIVPANVSGRWQFEQGGKGWRGTLDLQQAFQKVGGTLTVNRKPLPLLSPMLSGSELSFAFYNTDGTLRAIRGKVNGDTFEGWIRFEGYDTPITARRVSRPAAAAAKKAA